MKFQNNFISKILAKTKSSDFIFSAVLILFIILVIILFFLFTGFMLKSINKIFSSNTTENTQTLDMARYSLVAKKLNLPTN